MMSPESRFWIWFIAHEDELLHFERHGEALFDALASELKKVDPDLTFEFGPLESGAREFVISAAGMKRAFSAVQSLTATAPELRRWHLTAFRPRRTVLSIIEFGKYRISPDDVQYSLLRGRDGALGLYLFIPGYTDERTDTGQIGYLFLDEALGEYDVEMKVGLIKMFPPEAHTPGPRYPLKELAAHFDERYANGTAKRGDQ
jgi:hypothetical protein